ncbi:MAG TPA: RNA methyltransferase [Candidatus Omnitrophota bacterium]|nr:RNA methyltransferase [Candidatus Omnitrophota bacterium]
MRLYGKNPVLERLKSNPQSIRRITLQEGHPDAGYFYKKGRQWGIPVVVVPKSKMLKLARNVNSQGVIFEVEDFSYTPFDDALVWAQKKKAAMIFLDELTDPQNLGGMMRTLACLGDFVIVIPTHKSVAVTEAVLRVACGGDNYVKVSKVSNLGQAIRHSRDEGYWIGGTVVQGGTGLSEVVFPELCGLVVGSEQKGVRSVLLKLVGQEVTIPMAQPRLSMNVAHAVTVMAYEIIRQKGRRA